ncbi:melanopsin-like isoform X2 [Lampetra fluviatilis]
MEEGSMLFGVHAEPGNYSLVDPAWDGGSALGGPSADPQLSDSNGSDMSDQMREKFPMLDIPHHVHHTIGSVVIAIGFTGIIGNFLVIYVFCRSKSLRSPANIFIINLAFADFFMSITQTPIFFVTSLHKRWIFGEKGCELYAFCGALFGIASMITLVVIATDRYLVLTRPLASIGAMSKRRAMYITAAVWFYSLAWSLPPFFGWSAYVPEGLMTSCTWDYVTFTPAVRSYTMLLFCFVFFIPLIVIIFCYVRIFVAIKNTNRAVKTLGDAHDSKESQKQQQRMNAEWKLAKIALIVILLYVVSWSPYSCVALVAWAGYADMLTPYMNSVPAIIAKASAIHNPIVYAITHPKYRQAIGKYVPCLRALFGVVRKGSRTLSGGSFQSTRHSTLSSQMSCSGDTVRWHRQPTCTSDSESCWTDMEGESGIRTRPASRQVSYDLPRDTIEGQDLGKARCHDSGMFEKTSLDIDNISLVETGSTQGREKSPQGILRPIPYTNAAFEGGEEEGGANLLSGKTGHSSGDERIQMDDLTPSQGHRVVVPSISVVCENTNRN